MPTRPGKKGGGGKKIGSMKKNHPSSALQDQILERALLQGNDCERESSIRGMHAKKKD